MSNSLSTFSLGKHVVLGRTFFTPPRKISDALRNEARIVHVVKGHSRLHSADQTMEISSGDSFIMKCDNFVNDWLPNIDNTQNEVIVFQFNPDLFREIYEQKTPTYLSKTGIENVKAIQKIPSSGAFENFIQGLRFYLDNPESFTEEIIMLKIRELMHVLVEADKDGSIRTILAELFDTNSYQFKDIIQTHLFEDLNLKDLAFFTGLSLSSFKRKFSTVYGTSPNKYIISKRLEKAQILLKTSELRISEIAYDCGFNDLGYFSKSFKNNYKLSPSEYRSTLVI
ncbi:MAG: helix-turn-helix transcriptional regulator [Crocinitomicaceae bacterium]|nr:AraC family transcriptional regulator [Flavobacteriales bacterium]NQZ38152.1 helix-turn-helix transcriptional regulator [Crocinitomicaceae bacterium]